MPLHIDSIAVSSTELGCVLKTLKYIGNLEIRQARFFSSRLPNVSLQEDFHILLLLLLASLCKGYPRARDKDMAELFENMTINNCIAFNTEEMHLIFQSGKNLSSFSGAIRRWFSETMNENLISRLAPLVNDCLNPEGSSQPLVIYDRAHKTFSFQAYYLSEILLSEAFPLLLKKTSTELNIPKAKSALVNSLKLSFAGRKAHIRQILAGILSLTNKFVIISGGPGTGKSTVVHLIIRAVCEYYDIPVGAVILSAPTGRAKARLLEAVTRELPPGDPFSTTRARTIHSLLKINENGKPFYTKDNLLPYRLIVVDEVSMVDMRLFAQLIESLSPQCRLVLVGDMNQLPPVEAGAVLGDLTFKLSESGVQSSLSKGCLAQAGKIISGMEQIEGTEELLCAETGDDGIMVDHVVFLTRNYRSDRSIMQWWEKRLNGDEARESTQEDLFAAVQHIKAADLKGGNGVEANLAELFRYWMDQFAESVYEPWKNSLRPYLTNSDIWKNLNLAGEFRAIIENTRLLCCVHDGPFGRIRANTLCDLLFRKRKGISANSRWHDGQPVIVNRNQGSASGLYNGDLGIILEDKGGVYGCFAVGGGILKIPVERISDLDQAYSISVHKSQGSEFDQVMLLVPESSSMPITRQLVYTGITRAKRSVCIVDAGDRLVDGGILQEGERYSFLGEVLN